MELLVVIIVTVAAVAAVLYPLLRGDARDEPIGPEHDERAAEDAGEEVARYRTALRARTLCRRCGFANPEGSVFCAECGRRLEAGRTASRRRGGVRSGAVQGADRADGA